MTIKNKSDTYLIYRSILVDLLDWNKLKSIAYSKGIGLNKYMQSIIKKDIENYEQKRTEKTK